jgi:hypothetical protein
MGSGLKASSVRRQELLGWRPQQVGLIADSARTGKTPQEPAKHRKIDQEERSCA